jgi:hypothetical protein
MLTFWHITATGQFGSSEPDSTSARLEKEFIQNALDARLNGQPVRVRFILGKLDPESASPYIESLGSGVF